MNNNRLKKGGLDTIIAYIVVMLPLIYVLIFMIATLFHFTVQMRINQIVKEALVMASTYGDLTGAHCKYIKEGVARVLNEDDDVENGCEITCYVRRFDYDTGKMAENLVNLATPSGDLGRLGANKADIVGVYVKSSKPSMLGRVSAFNVFGANDEASLYYYAYREEIIRNEKRSP